MNFEMITAPRLQAELRAACEAAWAGGHAAMPFYGSARATEKDGGSPVTEADHAANAVIVDRLRAAFPGDALLSEETRDSLERLSSGRVWIVDPLDGTKEFLAQNGEFSVMVGLAVDGRAVAGAVYAPATGLLMYAAEGGGAWMLREGGAAPERLAVAPAAPGALRFVGSRSHPDPLLTRMQQELQVAEVRPSGSVGIKCGLIALGVCDVYVHPVPYLREWDTCAPEVILREAGGAVVDCTGGGLRYNKPDTRQPDGIVACAGSTLEWVMARVAPAYAAAAAA